MACRVSWKFQPRRFQRESETVELFRKITREENWSFSYVDCEICNIFFNSWLVTEQMIGQIVFV